MFFHFAPDLNVGLGPQDAFRVASLLLQFPDPDTLQKDFVRRALGSFALESCVFPVSFSPYFLATV